MAHSVVEFQSGEVDIVDRITMRNYDADAEHPVESICGWKKPGSKKRTAYAVKVFKCGQYTMLWFLLWAPAQRKRAIMLYFANVFFFYLFFYGRLILRPW